MVYNVVRCRPLALGVDVIVSWSTVLSVLGLLPTVMIFLFHHLRCCFLYDY